MSAGLTHDGEVGIEHFGVYGRAGDDEIDGPLTVFASIFFGELHRLMHQRSD